MIRDAQRPTESLVTILNSVFELSRLVLVPVGLSPLSYSVEITCCLTWVHRDETPIDGILVGGPDCNSESFINSCIQFQSSEESTLLRMRGVCTLKDILPMA